MHDLKGNVRKLQSFFKSDKYVALVFARQMLSVNPHVGGVEVIQSPPPSLKLFPFFLDR